MLWHIKLSIGYLQSIGSLKYWTPFDHSDGQPFLCACKKCQKQFIDFGDKSFLWNAVFLLQDVNFSEKAKTSYGPQVAHDNAKEHLRVADVWEWSLCETGWYSDSKWNMIHFSVSRNLLAKNFGLTIVAGNIIRRSRWNLICRNVPTFQGTCLLWGATTF